MATVLNVSYITFFFFCFANSWVHFTVYILQSSSEWPAVTKVGGAKLWVNCIILINNTLIFTLKDDTRTIPTLNATQKAWHIANAYHEYHTNDFMHALGPRYIKPPVLQLSIKSTWKYYQRSLPQREGSACGWPAWYFLYVMWSARAGWAGWGWDTENRDVSIYSCSRCASFFTPSQQLIDEVFASRSVWFFVHSRVTH